MKYLPCERCRFDHRECERRRGVAAAVRAFNRATQDGTQITSLRFSCPDRVMGYEPGALVEVETLAAPSPCGVERAETVGGVVLGHRGHKVEIFLDRETDRGKRWILVYPRPRSEGGSIGVRLTGKRIPAIEAARMFVREARRRRGEVGDLDFYCPDCGEFFLECEEVGRPPDRGRPDVPSFRRFRCPKCGSEEANDSELLVEEIMEARARKATKSKPWAWEDSPANGEDAEEVEEP